MTLAAIPLQAGGQATPEVQAFFENLLPEGELRDYLAAQRKASPLFSLLLEVYDLMCTRLYPGLSPEFAFAIGGEVRPGEMTADNLALMTRPLGTQPRFRAQQARDMADSVPDAIGQAMRELAPALTPSAGT